MHWILESGLEDFGYQLLIKNLEKANIKHTIVKVVPYQNILLDKDFDTFKKEPTKEDNIYINNKELIFPFGTMSLSRISTERNWKVGSLYNEEFNYNKWSKGFGLENLLNSETQIIKIQDSIELENELFFIRPCEDNKAFTGKVVSKSQFLDWQKIINKINDKRSKLNSETEILIAPYKEIQKEVRLFIFEGKVITGSYYKIGAKVIYEELKNGDSVIEYAEKMCEGYQPAQAFVLDVAMVDNDYKIIEINNINSVGLYNSNVNKFIEAVETTNWK